MKILSKIVITTVPKISQGGCTPYIEVLCGKDFELIWTNKNSLNLKNYKSKKSKMSGHHTKISIDVDQAPLLCGDIYIRLVHKGSMNNKMICRFAMNTSFI
jgi:hypothetical protein